jgi:hypothetical protein
MTELDPPVITGDQAPSPVPREQPVEGPAQDLPGIAAGVRRPGLLLAFLCIAQFTVFLDGM